MTGPRGSRAPDWLVQRPIAHRGLHQRSDGRIENSLSAARAARAAGYAIECDVQRSADGEALVFHDADLGRLTRSSARVADLDAERAAVITLDGSADHIPTLRSLFGVVDGAVPIVCEIKTGFDGDVRLADRVADLADTYPGPLAIKSFDPAVLLHLRRRGIERPVGIVSAADFDDPHWAALSLGQRHAMVHMLHVGETRPDFLSFRVDDLPHAVPCLMRQGMGLPVMAWTVRTPEQRQIAAPWVDQIVFEGFAP